MCFIRHCQADVLSPKVSDKTFNMKNLSTISPSRLRKKKKQNSDRTKKCFFVCFIQECRNLRESATFGGTKKNLKVHVEIKYTYIHTV